MSHPFGYYKSPQVDVGRERRKIMKQDWLKLGKGLRSYKQRHDLQNGTFRRQTEVLKESENIYTLAFDTELDEVEEKKQLSLERRPKEEVSRKTAFRRDKEANSMFHRKSAGAGDKYELIGSSRHFTAGLGGTRNTGESKQDRTENLGSVVD